VNRRLFSLLVAAAIASAVLVGALLAARDVASESESPPTRLGGGGPYWGSEPPAGIRIPTFALRDVLSGGLVRSCDLSGRVVLVTFLDTDCNEQCPLIAGQIGRALARLGEDERAKTTAVAISVNPHVDTRASVERFLRDHRVSASSTTERHGSRAQARLARLSDRLGLRDRRRQYPFGRRAHLDREGEWVATLHAGADLSSANLAHDVATALESRA
jgi:cytochrome oxidase Cu insertion factor (SCO1/SenC/PrrC family)